MTRTWTARRKQRQKYTTSIAATTSFPAQNMLQRYSKTWSSRRYAFLYLFSLCRSPEFLVLPFEFVWLCNSARWYLQKIECMWLNYSWRKFLEFKTYGIFSSWRVFSPSLCLLLPTFCPMSILFHSKLGRFQLLFDSVFSSNYYTGLPVGKVKVTKCLITMHLLSGTIFTLKKKKF